MSNIDFQNGFAIGVASKGQIKVKEETPNPLEYAPTVANVFQNTTFPDGYNLVLTLPRCSTFTYFAYNTTGVKTITIKDLPEDTVCAVGYAFRNSTSLETISFDDKTVKIGNGVDAFRGTSALKEIKGTLDLTDATSVNNMFEACTSLEYVRFKANSIKISISFAKCTKLTSETVQSIIDGLATVETAQTVTLNANQKVLQSHIDSANAKGWTVVGGTVVQEAW